MVKAKYNDPRYTYHDGLLLRAAIDARDRARSDLATRGVNALTLDAVGAVILSAAAAEAFANELPGRINEAMRHAVPVTDELKACAEVITELEDAHAGTFSKFQFAVLTLSGKLPKKGAKPLQDFHQLCRLRNALVHPKPIPDRKLIDDFARRGLTTDRRHPPSAGVTGLTWMNRMFDPAIADWACATSHRMMLVVLELI